MFDYIRYTEYIAADNFINQLNNNYTAQYITLYGNDENGNISLTNILYNGTSNVTKPYDHTYFSDLTQEEFGGYVMNSTWIETNNYNYNDLLNQAFGCTSHKTMLSPDLYSPYTFSSIECGDVYNQGGYETCWALGSTNQFECNCNHYHSTYIYMQK